MGGMTETTTAPTKPSGTRAMLYAVLSIPAGAALWVVAYVLAETADVSGFTVLGVFVAAAGVVGGAGTAIVQRLAFDRPERVSLGRVAALAMGVPATVLLLGLVLDLILR
jgi:hypothetical protein